MKTRGIFKSILFAGCWLGIFVFFTAQAWAVDQTELKGVVTVEVDHSKAIWDVKITNLSKENLTYEMINFLPRGLGVEIWEGEWGAHLFAGDLAKFANTDGFPADFRELAPGAAMTFALDPKSMSSLDPRVITKWQKFVDDGYYSCRVVFGIYASPTFRVNTDDESVTVKKKKSDLAEVMDLGFWKEGVVGLRIRQELQRTGHALVSYNYSSSGGKDSEYHVELTTVAVKDFEANPQWKGDEDLPLALKDLVSRARKIAEERAEKFELETLAISQCSDDPEKRYVTVYFLPEGARNYESFSVDLLLNGAVTNDIRLPLTEDEYGELSKYGIPKVPVTEDE